LLLRHLEIHNGENPYCCDQCPKWFSRLAHLQQHSDVHSEKKEKQVFSCSLCPKVYLFASSLKKHMKISHPS
jgi:KRAB domain-containing zinc finger protein